MADMVTREEQLKDAVRNMYLKDCIASEFYYKGLLKAAQWADDNPYWYNYNENIPPSGIEVLCYNEGWIDKDFCPDGIRIGYRNDGSFVHIKWDNDQDMWWPVDSDLDKDRVTEPLFPTHWKFYPKPPKTEQQKL